MEAASAVAKLLTFPADHEKRYGRALRQATTLCRSSAYEAAVLLDRMHYLMIWALEHSGISEVKDHLDNFLWNAYVHACRDNPITILTHLNPNGYMIPRAQAWVTMRAEAALRHKRKFDGVEEESRKRARVK